MKPIVVVFIALLVPTLAVADVPPDIEPGREFVTHHLAIENMADHPEFSILAYDAAGMIRAHRVFTDDGDTQQRLVNGGNWRSRNDFGSPQLWLLGRAEQEAWSEATSAEVSRQREACERGEGCAHISRFSPSYPPPEGAIACDAQISITHDRPIDTDSQSNIVHIYRLTEASAEVCTVELLSGDQNAVPPADPVLPVIFTIGAFLLIGLAAWVFYLRVAHVKRTRPRPVGV